MGTAVSQRTERRREMYRDLIGEVVRITTGSRAWYYQQFCKPDGNLKCVRLYDEDGDFVSEFKSMDALYKFLPDVERS